MTCLVFSLLGGDYMYWEESAWNLARKQEYWSYSAFRGLRPLYRIRMRLK
jgi:hypothetical protein